MLSVSHLLLAMCCISAVCVTAQDPPTESSLDSEASVIHDHLIMLAAASQEASDFTSLSSLDQNQETSVIQTPSVLFESTNDDSEDDDNESRDVDESSTVSTRKYQESDDYKDSYDSDDYGYDDYDSSDKYNDYDNGYGRRDYSHGFGRPRYYKSYNGHPLNVFGYPNYYRGGYYNRF